MQHRHLARTLVTAGAATALAIPAAAYAESVHHHDPAHDVQQVSTADGTTTNLPKNRTADIVGLDLAFTKKHVAVTIRTRKAASNWMFGANIKTPKRIFTVLGTHDDTSTDFELLRGATSLGTPVTCPGLRHHVDLDHATITVKVPDTCIKDPHWVRSGVALLVPVTGGNFDVDDALRKRGAAEEGVTLSKRLHHA
jgi:hypothetical protein